MSPEVRVDCRALCVRVRVRPCHGFAALEAKSDDPSMQNRGGPKARVAPSRPKVTTLPCKTAGVQKRATLPPEPSRARPCHGFAALEAKSDDPVQKRAPLPPELSRARPCHGFAARETKSDDPSMQNGGGPKARAATARALYSTPRARPCHGFAALETKSDDPPMQNRGGPKARAATARAL